MVVIIAVHEPLEREVFLYREYVKIFEGKDLGDSGMLRRRPYTIEEGKQMV